MTGPAAPGPDLGDPGALAAVLRAAGCVFAEDEAALLLGELPAHPDPAWLPEAVARRVAGVPLEQVVGWAAFAGLRLPVAPGVFVPRRRTELLARLAVAAARDVPARSGAPTVLDLCCGTGAVGAVVERDVPSAVVWAVDLDPAAADCARRVLAEPDRVLVGDLCAPLPDDLWGSVDVVAANAPYVPTGALATMPPEARLHERGAALDGGADGTALQARVVTEAVGWLRPGGRLLVETGRDQADATAALFAAAGLRPVVHRDDDVDGTVVAGVRPASGTASRP